MDSDEQNEGISLKNYNVIQNEANKEMRVTSAETSTEATQLRKDDFIRQESEKMMKTDSETRHSRIAEKIRYMTKSSIEHETKEILKILDEVQHLHIKEELCILSGLIERIDDFYQECHFAQLVQALNHSYQLDDLSRGEDLCGIIWKELKRLLITSELHANECIAKLKLLLPLEVNLSTRLLWNFTKQYLPTMGKNPYFINVLTFLVEGGADPFKLIDGSTAFTLLAQKFSFQFQATLTASVISFLEEAFKHWSHSKNCRDVLNVVIRSAPSSWFKQSSCIIKELILSECQKMVHMEPGLCNEMDADGKTPLHNLLEKLLIDGLWKRIPGIDSLWNFMTSLLTNENVNIRDRYKVTPYTWILFLKEALSHDVSLETQEQNVKQKIDDINKLFTEKGANQEDALEGLESIHRYMKIEEKIQCLTKYNIEKEAEEIITILEEGEVVYVTEGPSIICKLLENNYDLYQEPSFAQLVRALYPSYQRNLISSNEDLTGEVWRYVRYLWAEGESEPKASVRIISDSTARETISKLKIFIPLESIMTTRLLVTYIGTCDLVKETNRHYIDFLTFLIKEGANPFEPIKWTTAFTSFLEKFGFHLNEELLPSVLTFLEEALKKWDNTKVYENILNDVVKAVPSFWFEKKSDHLSPVKELLLKVCLKMIKTRPSLCDQVDADGKTPLHNLMEKLLIDGLWQKMPELITGTVSLWSFMTCLMTDKNVNIGDKNSVTPFTWISVWREEVKDVLPLDAPDRVSLAKKIEEINKLFLGRAASMEQAQRGLQFIRKKTQIESWCRKRYKRIEEKVQGLTRFNIEEETKNILGILDEGEIVYPEQGPSIIAKLVEKTADCYQEHSFAELIKTLYPSYGRSTLSHREELPQLIWNELDDLRIVSQSKAKKCIDKLKIFLHLDGVLDIRILMTYVDFCDVEKERNPYFVGVITFLVEEGINPFVNIGGKTAFTSFLDMFGSNLPESLIPSVLKFLEVAIEKMKYSRIYGNILNDIVKSLPSQWLQGDSRHYLHVKELYLNNCLKMIQTKSYLCDEVDVDGKTPLHNLMEKLLIDDVWKEIPDLITGTSNLWNFMASLVSNKNVNMTDRYKVTPYTWILFWKELLSHDVSLETQEQSVKQKIDDVNKLFTDEGANEEGALEGLKSIQRFKLIEEIVCCLTTPKMAQATDEISTILDQGVVFYPNQGPSVIYKLIEKTSYLHEEPSFMRLIQTLFPSYQASSISTREDLTEVLHQQLKNVSMENSKTKEFIAKLKVQ